MTITNAIRTIMNESGVTVGNIAARLNVKQNVVSERLSQTNMSFAKALEMLRVVDYKIVLMPREAATPKGGIVVDGKEEKK